MTDSPEPEITVSAVLAESVPDDQPPRWPVLPDLPAVSDVPRESATNAVQLAEGLLLTVVSYWNSALPALTADPPVVDMQAVEDVAELRRRFGMLTDTIIRRALSHRSVLLSEQTARIAERVAGITLAAAQDTDVDPHAEHIFGRALGRVVAMGAPDDEQFALAADRCLAQGGLTYERMVAALAIDNLSEVEQDQRAIMVRLANEGRSVGEIAEFLGLTLSWTTDLVHRYDITVKAPPARTEAVDTPAIVAHVIASTASAGRAARSITPADVEALPPAECADLSRELWETAKYVLQLRKILDDRARAR